MKKRILLITVRSDFGGGPKHVDQLVYGLNSEFDLYLASPRGVPFGDSWADSSLIKGFFELPFRRFSVLSLFHLIRFISANDISVVHSHGNGAGFYSRFIKLLLPTVNVIHTFHGIVDLYDSRIKRLAFRLSGRFFKYLTDWSVFVSRGEHQIGQKLGFVREGRYSVIYNGVDPSPYLLHSKKTLHKGDFIVVSLTRFDFAKNMRMAFEIAKKMLPYENIKFVWVGDGPDYVELFSLAKTEGVDNVEFIGFSKFPQKYLAEASLYLSTSRFEGLPYGLIEASASGLPIVASNVRGNNEVAIDGQNAILFENVDQAVKAILEFFASEQKYVDASRSSLEVFRNKFELSKMLDRLKLLYLTTKL